MPTTIVTGNTHPQHHNALPSPAHALCSEIVSLRQVMKVIGAQKPFERGSDLGVSVSST